MSRQSGRVYIYQVSPPSRQKLLKINNNQRGGRAIAVQARKALPPCPTWPRAGLPVALLVVVGAAACSSNVERLAAEQQLVSEVRTGDGYRHRVLTRPSPATVERLHVYIEGDGIPWINGRVPAVDPTPRRAYALELMALDDWPSAYVGRPCYFGLAGDDTCATDDWTFGRYSERIVKSLARVVRDLCRQYGSKEVVLIGYSGGGALARLVAADVPQALAVVTLAGNLDTAAWTRAHAYLPLSGSLNPATAAPLPAEVRHVQIIGSADDVVPTSVTDSYRHSGQQVDVWVYDDFDHRCCWTEAWPGILDRVNAWIAAPGDGSG